jgi:four helix bundle protein
VAANISEAWRKRRYPASFVSKLNDAEGEAAETQTWLQFAVECGYANAETSRDIYAEYDSIIAMLVNMQNHPEDWSLTKRQ